MEPTNNSKQTLTAEEFAARYPDVATEQTPQTEPKQVLTEEEFQQRYGSQTQDTAPTEQAPEKQGLLGRFGSMLAEAHPHPSGLEDPHYKALAHGIVSQGAQAVTAARMATPPEVVFNPAAPYGMPGNIGWPILNPKAPPEVIDLRGERDKVYSNAVKIVKDFNEKNFARDENEGSVAKFVNDTLEASPSVVVATLGFLVGGPLGAGVAGGMLEAAAKYDEVISSGGSEAEAYKQAAMLGVGTGALNAVPWMNAFGKYMPKNRLGKYGAWLINGFLEGATETLEGGLDPIAALDKIPKSPEEMETLARNILQGVWDEREVFGPSLVLGLAMVSPTAIQHEQMWREIESDAKKTVAAQKKIDKILQKEDDTPSVDINNVDMHSTNVAELVSAAVRMSAIAGSENEPPAIKKDARKKLGEINDAIKVLREREANAPKSKTTLFEPTKLYDDWRTDFEDLKTQSERNAFLGKMRDVQKNGQPNEIEAANRFMDDVYTETEEPTAEKKQKRSASKRKQQVKAALEMTELDAWREAWKGQIAIPQTLTPEDFGGRMPPAVFSSSGKTRWDVALQDAYNRGIINESEATDPATFRRLWLGNARPNISQLLNIPKGQESLDEMKQSPDEPVPASELSEDDLVYRNGEWHRFQEATETEDAKLIDGEELTVDPWDDVNAAMVVKPGQDEYNYAKKEFRAQEKAQGKKAAKFGKKETAKPVEKAPVKEEAAPQQPAATEENQYKPPETADDLPDVTQAKKIVWHHGSNVDLTIESPNFAAAAISGQRLGVGLYLTDRKEIADTYAKKRSKKRGQPQTVSVKVNPRKVVNFDKPLGQDVVSAISSAIDDFTGDLSSQNALGERPFIQEAFEKAVKEGKIGTAVWDAMISGVGDYAEWHSMSEDEISSLFYNINESLLNAGYDALTHIGGITAGNGTKKHRVLVLLDPNSSLNDHQTITNIQKIDTEPQQPAAPTQRVVRFDEPGTEATTSKPQGLYLNREGTSTGVEEGMTERSGYMWHPQNALDVSGDTENVTHARFGDFKQGEPSAGIKALRSLVDPEEFERLRKLSKAKLSKELSEKYPDVEWNKYFDSYEMLEGLAGTLAREGGYDAITDTDEIVALDDSAITPETQPQTELPTESTPEPTLTSAEQAVELYGSREKALDALANQRAVLEEQGDPTDEVDPVIAELAKSETTKALPEDQAPEGSRPTKVKLDDGTEIDDAYDYMSVGVNDKTGAVSVVAVPSLLKRGWSRTKHAFNRYLTAPMDLPLDVYRSIVNKDRKFRQVVLQTLHTQKNFDRILKRGKATKADKATISAYMHGTVNIDQVRPEFRKIANKMRKEIDNYTREAIRKGVVTGELADTFQENLGMWLHRNYRILKDPQFAKRMAASHPELINLLQTNLESEYTDPKTGQPLLTPEQIQGKIDQILEGPGLGVVEFLKGRRTGQKDLGPLMKRTEYTLDAQKETWETIRKLWGEETDVVANFGESILAMAQLNVNHAFLEDIKRAGLGKFLFEKPYTDPKTGEAHIYQIAPPGHIGIAGSEYEISWQGGVRKRTLAKENFFVMPTPDKTMSPIGNLYTTKEIAQAFNAAFEPNSYGKALELLVRASSMVKVGKTILSPATQFGNFFANFGFLMQQGHWRVTKFGAATKLTMTPDMLTELLGNDPVALQKIKENLTLLGVLNDSTHLGEIKMLTRAAMKGDVDVLFGGSTAPRKFGSKAFGAAKTLYGLSDDFFKVYGFYNEYADYKKALAGSGMTDKEIRQIAADIVTDTYPTYSKAYRAAKKLARFPLVGNFPTFTAELVRTSLNTLKIAGREWKNPQLRGIAARRTVGFLSTHALFAGLATVIERWVMQGLEKDKDDFREYMADWDKNSPVAMIAKGEGTAKFVTTRFNPFQWFQKPVLSMLKGEDWTDKIGGAMLEALEPFFGPEILTEALVGAITNKRGIDVLSPLDVADITSDDRTVQSAIERMWWMAEQVAPGAISQGINLANGAESSYRESKGLDPIGNDFKKFTLLDEISRTLGVRIISMDLNVQLPIKASEFQRRLRGAHRPMLSLTYSNSRITPNQFKHALKSTDAQRQALFYNMKRKVDAALRSGISYNKVEKMLRDAQIGVRDTEILLGNRPYEPYTYKPKQLTQVLNRIRP